MATWQSNFVDVNGLKLHYLRSEGGNGKPALVMAHGFSDDGSCWLPVAEELASEYDILLPDARGHGKSDAPEQGYGIIDMANDLAGIITALRLEKPAILGHSMGGATTYMLAATYPEMPGKILIEDAGAINLGTDPPSEEQKARWAGMRRWVEGLKRQTRDELLEAQRKATPHWSEAELIPWADSKHRLSVRVLNRADAPPIDWAVLLPNIACPALLIIGDAPLGGMVTVEAAQDLQQQIRGLQVAHIPGTGHSIRRDKFEEYLQVVTDFLKVS